MTIDADKAFEVQNGLQIANRINGDLDVGPLYTGGTASPAGLDLPVNTFYLQITSTGFLVWLKFNTGSNDWRRFDGRDLPFSNVEFEALNIQDAVIETGVNAVAEAIDVPRSPMLLTHNGTISNGQLVGYSNLANIAPIIPFRGSIKEFSFSNGNNGVDCDFRIYRNSESPANLIYTWQIRDLTTDFVTDSSFTSPEFERGDTLIIRYDDQGTNANDMTFGIYWKVLQDE